MILIGFNNCKQKAREDIAADTKIPMYETAEFKQFYDAFSTDSVYQMEHIIFPLEGARRLIDSLDKADPDFRWQKENWVLHKQYDDMNGTFSREMLDLSGSIIIERISDNSGKYSMERRFGKLSSGWHLIYYKEMGMY
ncbi:MAG: hypothetical protein IPO92_17760 [Saprospiraceae bacterium]|nr:hypothetical protein [Saprospiraceae bacterium]